MVKNYKDIKGQPFIYRDYECEKDNYDEEEIVNHSKNKIDLVETGDYVNGMLVVEVLELVIIDKKHQERVVSVNRDEKCTLAPLLITNKDIKSIVTKEQYKSVEYVF